MSSNELTSKQRNLIKELEVITEDLGLGFGDIGRYPTPEERTVHLERIKTHLIRGEVITQFTLVEEMLTYELAIEALGGHRAKPWRHKKTRFDRFKQVLTENRASLRPKLGLYEAFRRVPRDIREITLALNSIRNAFAHSFSVGNQKKSVKYRGQNIMDLAVFKRFLIDQRRLLDFLVNR